MPRPPPHIRLLRLFGDIRPGEGRRLALMFGNVFLIMNAYYLLKPVRDGLIIGGSSLFGLSGAGLKAALPGVMAVLLVPFVLTYSWMDSRMSRRALLATTNGFVIVCLVVFGVLGGIYGAGTKLGITFFVWLGMINYFVIAQFWSFANDIYDEAEGKRLFAIIAVGQSLGALVGPQLASWGRARVFDLPLLAAAMFGASLWLFMVVDKRVPRPERPAPRKSSVGGFKLVLSSRYLLLIAATIVVSNLVNTTGENILGVAVEGWATEAVPALHADITQSIKDARTQLITGWYGDFYATVNIAALLLQLFVVSRVFRYAGVRVAVFILPVVALGGYVAIGLIGGLLIMRAAKTAENSTDYSLQNTLRQVLFLPLSRAEKYKAKVAIDTVFVRAGDALAAGLFLTGLAFNFELIHFAIVNVCLCAVWIAISMGVAHEHRRIHSESSDDPPDST